MDYVVVGEVALLWVVFAGLISFVLKLIKKNVK